MKAQPNEKNLFESMKMSVFFDASEILRFAVRIEENGEQFYRHAVRVTEDDDAKEIFDHLADEETKHKETFEDMLSKIEKYEPFESYPGEYFAYLRDYVDRIIFENEVLDHEISKVTDTSSAIDFGIQRELESILYYHEIKKFVPESQHVLVDGILDEERKHFSKLSEIRKEYAGTQ